MPKIADVIYGRPPGRRANLGAYKSASSLDTFLTNKAIAIGTLPLLHVGLLDSCQGFIDEIKPDLILLLHGSVVGPVIQANGRLSFGDDLSSGGLFYCVSQ